MHPDHSAGLTDPKTGRRLFPNAELVVHENEPRHWNDDTAMAKASERAKRLYFQCAREQMAPYHSVMHTFSGSVDVFPGVTSVPLHGHTPGHSGYMISSGRDTLLIWGDIVHVPDIQIPRPEVTIEFDTDPHAAAATRKQVLDEHPRTVARAPAFKGMTFPVSFTGKRMSARVPRPRRRWRGA